VDPALASSVERPGAGEGAGRAERLRALAIAVLLGGATLGEGGATPTALFLVHLAVAALLCLEWVRPGVVRFRTAAAPTAAFVCFAGLVLAGALVAPYRFGAWLVLLELGVFASVAWIAGRRSPQLLPALVAVLPVFAAAQGALAIGQALFLNEARPAGTFLNTNHLGAWLVAVACLAAAALLDGASRRRTLWTAALAGPALAALFLTASRGAFGGVVAAVTAFALLAARRRATALFAGRTRFALLAGVLALTVVLGLGLLWRFRVGEHLNLQRPEIWRASLSAALAAPWSGTGPGQFRSAAANLNFPVREGPLRFERYFESPHSDWLRVPAELGWPAALVLAVLAWLTLREWRRSVARVQALHVGAIAALSALAAQAMVDDLSDRPALYLLAAALLGASLAEPAAARAKASRPARSVALAGLALLVLVGDAAPWLSWRESRALPHGRLDVAGSTRLERALGYNPLHPELWLRKAENVAGDGTDWTPAGYAAAREAAEHAVRLDPTDALYWRGLARIEALACQTLFPDVATRERAARAYEAAMARSLHDPFLPLELAGFLLQTGDVAGARRAAERSLRIEPESVAARVMLAAVLAEAGTAGDAARSAELLAEARAKARQWSSWRRETPYAKALLDLDAAWEGAVVKRLRAQGRPLAGPAGE
jgi:O-antigen ligase